MNYYVLFNPLAGKSTTKENFSSLSAIYKDNVTYYDLTKINYAELLGGLGKDDAVILCGGDGTLNRFINETCEMDLKCDVLYYAAGTGNDFLRDIDKLSADKPFSIKDYISDLPSVEVNGKTYRFLNNVGFGIDGYCCEVGDMLKKKSHKPINYTAIAIKGLLFHYKPTNATVTVDGTEYNYKKVWLAPTMKGRFYGGGMMATPEQDRNAADGSLSVMIFFGKGRLRTLMAFPSIFKGEHIKYTNMVAIHKGTDIHVKFDSPTALQIDGETILGVTEYKAVAKVPAKVI